MMAATYSDEGSAPIDFNLSSTLYDNESKSTTEKCLLCSGLRRTFYCKLCVRNGDFVSSTPQLPERFADKKLRWLKVASEKEEVRVKCLKMIVNKEKRTVIELELKECAEQIKLLRQLIREKNEAIKQSNKVIETVMEKNKARLMRLPRYKERVDKLQSYVARHMTDELKHRRVKLDRVRGELEKVVQKNINDLVQFIFPISKINPISKSEDEDTVSALAEATSTSYVRGKWVFMDSWGELQHKIVAPTLPGSGDYSAYSVWVASNKNGVPDTEKIQQNQAYNIGAALSYTTQLVNLLAFYLDVILPKKVTYSDFTNMEMSDSKLLAKVSKLNTNILYLCFSQGIDTTNMNPKHTLSNVLYLIHHQGLGQVGPFEIDSNLVMSLETIEVDVKKDEEGSDSDENDTFPYEWEAIPLLPCPESSPGPHAISSHQVSHLDSQSVAGGLVTSLASIWRGWTGK